MHYIDIDDINVTMYNNKNQSDSITMHALYYYA